MAQIGINAQVMQVQMTQYASLRTVKSTGGSDFTSLFDGIRSLNPADRSDAKDQIRDLRSNTNAMTGSDGKTKTADAASQPKDKPSVSADKAQGGSMIGKAEETVLDASDDQGEESVFVSVVCTIMVQFAQILEITTDELMGNFEQLDLDPRDIVNGSGIGQLVMSMNNFDDMSDILMNGSLSDLVGELTEAVSEVLDEFAMNREMFLDAFSVEDLKKFMADVNSELTTMLKEADSILNMDAETVIKFAGTVLFDTENVKPENTGKDADADNGREAAVLMNGSGQAAGETVVKKTSDEDQKGLNSSLANGEVKEDIRNNDRSRRSVSDVETPFDRFVSGMEHAVKNSLSEISGTEAMDVREIVYQIVDSIKLSLSPDKNSIELQLTPESLGKVQLNVSSKEGVMTAKITTENEVARAAVESQLETLKETINAQGFKVESIEVTVSSFSFADSKNAETDRGEEGRSDKKRTAASALSGPEETIRVERDGDREQAIMAHSGSTVSYVA